MADGLFYVDHKPPFNYVSSSPVSLIATLQALLPAGAYPVLGANYFGYVGKAIRIRVAGQYTTGATPGNITIAYLWGSGANNSGTACPNGAVVGVANQSNNTWYSEAVIRCRALGVSGSLFGQGMLFLGGIGQIALPPSNPAAATVDLTQNFIINVQAARSGSTAETMTVHDLTVEALN